MKKVILTLPLLLIAEIGLGLTSWSVGKDMYYNDLSLFAFFNGLFLLGISIAGIIKVWKSL